MTTTQFLALLGAPSAIAALVSWLIEYWCEPFHALTPLGKKIATLLGCLALAWLVAGTGLYLGSLLWSRDLMVGTWLAGLTAFGAATGSHIPATGRR